MPLSTWHYLDWTKNRDVCDSFQRYWVFKACPTRVWTCVGHPLKVKISGMKRSVKFPFSVHIGKIRLSSMNSSIPSWVDSRWNTLVGTLNNNFFHIGSRLQFNIYSQWNCVQRLWWQLPYQFWRRVNAAFLPEQHPNQHSWSCCWKHWPHFSCCSCYKKQVRVNLWMFVQTTKLAHRVYIFQNNHIPPTPPLRWYFSPILFRFYSSFFSYFLPFLRLFPPFPFIPLPFVVFLTVTIFSPVLIVPPWGGVEWKYIPLLTHKECL